jgi:hypothetical protein
MACVDLCDLVKDCETLTGLTYDPATNTLTYTDEKGAAASHLLAGANETLTILGYDPATRALSYTDENGTVHQFVIGGIVFDFGGAPQVNAAGNTVICSPSGGGVPGKASTFATDWNGQADTLGTKVYQTPDGYRGVPEHTSVVTTLDTGDVLATDAEAAVLRAANTTGSANWGPPVSLTLVNPSATRSMSVFATVGGVAGAAVDRTNVTFYNYTDAQLGLQPSRRAQQVVVDNRGLPPQTPPWSAGVISIGEAGGTSDVAIVAPGASITLTAQRKWLKLSSNDTAMDPAASGFNSHLVLSMIGVTR